MPKTLDLDTAPFQPLYKTFGLGNTDTETDVTDNLRDHINHLYEAAVIHLIIRN